LTLPALTDFISSELSPENIAPCAVRYAGGVAMSAFGCGRRGLLARLESTESKDARSGEGSNTSVGIP
jgi:hypothetical protein